MSIKELRLEVLLPAALSTPTTDHKGPEEGKAPKAFLRKEKRLRGLRAFGVFMMRRHSPGLFFSAAISSAAFAFMNGCCSARWAYSSACSRWPSWASAYAAL